MDRFRDEKMQGKSINHMLMFQEEALFHLTATPHQFWASQVAEW